MRRLIVYIFIFVLLCFFVPVIFIRKPREEATVIEEKTESNVAQEEQTYTYQKYGKVKLLHTATGEVQELNMDEYLYRSCCC